MQVSAEVLLEVGAFTINSLLRAVNFMACNTGWACTASCGLTCFYHLCRNIAPCRR